MLSCHSCPRRRPFLLAKVLALFLFMCTTVFLVRRYSSDNANSYALPVVQSKPRSASSHIDPPIAVDSGSVGVMEPPTATKDYQPLSDRYSKQPGGDGSGGGIFKRARVIRRPELIGSDRRSTYSAFSDLERSRLDREIDRDLQLIDPELGSGGRAAKLDDARLAQLAERVMKKEALNVVLSDRISPNRSVPDARSHRCLERDYDISTLPSASVIIIFTNEAYSALVRTIHSVINMTPPRLLHEIILVDDFSDRVALGSKLERYIERFFNNQRAPVGSRPRVLVRLIRLRRRSGLIRARLAGARLSEADVLVFLDSHCECGVQWLEPLLQRIQQNRTAVVTPIIDVINDKTLEYHHSNGEFFQVGGFTWSGHFTWINVPQQEIERRGTPADPTRSPTMAGGLFAIDRQYFWESGSYDENMDVWGGENLEMSFRIWMCGGTVETVPCSRVGHIFRDFHPYTFPGNRDTHGLNTARLAEVWMDEYKRLFYLHRPDLKVADIGSVEERRRFRRQKKCKSFRWYLENVLPQKFIPDENVLAFGRVSNDLMQPSLCLDNMQNAENSVHNIGLYFCHNFMSTSQLFSLSMSGQLRREETCARVTPSSSPHPHQQPQQPQEERVSEGRVWMKKCDDSEAERWYYSQGMLQHVSSGLCLDRGALRSGDDVIASTCTGSVSQRWRFVRS